MIKWTSWEKQSDAIEYTNQLNVPLMPPYGI